jgi:hypothetical protein
MPGKLGDWRRQALRSQSVNSLEQYVPAIRSPRSYSGGGVGIVSETGGPVNVGGRGVLVFT